MDGHYQTGRSYTFLMMFSCAGMVATMMRGGAGVLAVLVSSGADTTSCTDYRCTQAAEAAA